MACILLIDDDPEVCSVLKSILESADHRVVEAQNGVEGLAKLDSEPLDLVISDILMPEKEGVETIIEIRRGRPEMPIIAISGGGATHNLSFLDLAGKLGADRILSKPIDANVLIDSVNDLLSDGQRARTKA